MHRALLWFATAAVLLHSPSLAEIPSPESLFNIPLRFPVEKLRYQQQLTRRARADIASYSCSSLEGPDCLYNQLSRVPNFWDSPEPEAAVNSAGVQFKVVLMTPQQGRTLQELLTDRLQLGEEDTEAEQQASAPEDGTEANRLNRLPQSYDEDGDGQIIFEGDDSSMQDMDRLMDTVAAALGISSKGPAADMLRNHLARVLTDAEFAAAEVGSPGRAGRLKRKEGVPVWARPGGGFRWVEGDDSAEGDGDYEEDDAGSEPSQQSQGEREEDGAVSAPWVRSPSAAGATRGRLAGGFQDINAADALEGGGAADELEGMNPEEKAEAQMVLEPDADNEDGGSDGARFRA